MPSSAAVVDDRWAAMEADGGAPRSVVSLGLRRSDKSSIAPKKPMRRGSDAMSEPPAFSSSQRKQSLIMGVSSSPKKGISEQPKITSPPVVVSKKSITLDDSLKRLDLEDITETEFTEDMSESNDIDTTTSSSPGRFGSGSNSSVHTAPADVRRYSKPSNNTITSSATAIDKDQRYANFDNGFGERRESRMRRVQRIKSTDRVMPSLESQQRAIANRRRSTAIKPDDNTTSSADRTQQELESVRGSTRMSIKERMAMFNGSANGSSSELASPF